jgi:hypothetical protein
LCRAGEALISPTSSPPADELRIVSKEFSFSIPPTRVAAGRSVTVVLDNSQGETEHRVVFTRLGLRLSATAGGVTKRR